MFNFLQNLQKKFKSYKKTSKINIFYFKNKKNNFVNSLFNYSKINKKNSWTNLITSIFSFKISKSTLKMYLLNTIIVLVFIYFEKNAIHNYFVNILPYEMAFNFMTYSYIANCVLEILLNF